MPPEKHGGSYGGAEQGPAAEPDGVVQPGDEQAGLPGAALRVLSLTGPRLEGQIALAWRARQQASPAARAFLAHAARADPG